MTSDVSRRPAPIVPSLTTVSLRSRIYGFGSVFGKTLRDSRRAIIVVSVFLALLLIGVSNAIVSEFATPESRAQLAAIVAAVPPILQGLAGKPVNVETLGGYLSYKYGYFFPLIISLWSIIALSGTLATHEKAIIEDALRASGGRVFGPSGAAARLGIPRSTLESKIRALRINKNRFRARPAKD